MGVGIKNMRFHDAPELLTHAVVHRRCVYEADAEAQATSIYSDDSDNGNKILLSINQNININPDTHSNIRGGSLGKQN